MNKEKKTRKSRSPKSGIGYRKIQEVFKLTDCNRLLTRNYWNL